MVHVWKSSQGSDEPKINRDEFDDDWDDDTDEGRVCKRVWKKDGGNGGSASFYGAGLSRAANEKRAPLERHCISSPSPTGLATCHHIHQEHEPAPGIPVNR